VRDCYPSSCPLRLGDCPSFYRPRREQFIGVPHYAPTCGGMACSATELTIVPDESCSSRGVVARPVLVQEQLRGWWCRGWLSGRRPRASSRASSTEVRTRYSGRHGDVPSPCVPTASGMSSQCPAWRCSGGDGRTGLTAMGKTAPAGPTSRRSPL
jgi:hypothetical protein